MIDKKGFKGGVGRLRAAEPSGPKSGSRVAAGHGCSGAAAFPTAGPASTSGLDNPSQSNYSSAVDFA
jgi:hypothetical protein